MILNQREGMIRGKVPRRRRFFVLGTNEFLALLVIFSLEFKKSCRSPGTRALLHDFAQKALPFAQRSFGAEAAAPDTLLQQQQQQQRRQQRSFSASEDHNNRRRRRSSLTALPLAVTGKASPHGQKRKWTTGTRKAPFTLLAAESPGDSTATTQHATQLAPLPNTTEAYSDSINSLERAIGALLKEHNFDREQAE